MENTAVQAKTERLTIYSSYIAECIIWLIYVVCMLLKCTHFQFSTKINSKPYFNTLNNNMFLASFASIIIIAAIVLLFFNRKRLIALFVADIMMTILLLSDTLYFRYYYNAITIPVLYQIGLVSSITDSAKSLIQIKDIIFLVDIPLFIGGFVFLKRQPMRGIKQMRPAKRITSAIMVLFVCFGLMRFVYGKSSYYMFPYDNNTVINDLGIYYFHYYDIKRNIQERFFTDHSLKPEEKSVLDSFFDEKNTGGSKYKGAASGKNLIIVQMEAIQQFIINTKFNGKEITPNLNKYINESIYLDNFYYQVGTGNTSDAELLTNTSLYPLRDGSVYFKYPANTYESLPKILKQQGYNSYVFHANNPSFWNRTEMYKSVGFDRFFSSKDFDMDEYLGWGLGDKSFFRQSLEKIDTSRPFYSFLITLSSHHPFNYFDDYQSFDVGEYEDTMAGNYVKAANYVDQAIGQLLDDLKRKGLYDNSVIVIYGDHHAVLKDQKDMIGSLIDVELNDYNWTKLHKTPCFIHFPGMKETGVNSTICGEIDLLPTIANLMGFEAPHALGKDILNTREGYAVLRDSSVITDEFIYVGSEGNVYDNEGQLVNRAEYDAEISKYQKELQISDIILSKNALASYKK